MEEGLCHMNSTFIALSPVSLISAVMESNHLTLTLILCKEKAIIERISVKKFWDILAQVHNSNCLHADASKTTAARI